ncbi:MAG: pyridoxal phosphate-dependent aminotransferase [Clostridiales bacterium]|nr:pyridoxal phosphate-dependent aminotransferase [Clostridiales bacterium]
MQMQEDNKKEDNNLCKEFNSFSTESEFNSKDNPERNTQFDQVIDRHNTDCLKYDFAVRRGRPADVLPLWVADMDFPTSSRVIDAIVARSQHGIFGYTETGDSYFEAVADWMHRHHGWEVRQEWMVKTPGVVFAIAMAVKAFTEPGDAVLIQQPVYYPFSEVIEDNGRVVVSSDLVLDGKRYRIDFADMEQQIIDNHVKLFLLCSPHNPVGRVWTREELQQVGEICLRHHVIVVADEIHEDFVFGAHKHTVFASLFSFADFTITCTSPAKTFNLAGLQVSNIFISNRKLRHAFKRQISASGYSQLNTLGLTAAEAAYRYGEEWYQAMMAYVDGNLQFLRDYLAKNLPEIRMTETEGTYLAWLDCRKLSVYKKSIEETSKSADARLEHFIVHDAGLWLDSGAIFGKSGQGFERINVACPRKTLQQALEQLKAAVDRYQDRTESEQVSSEIDYGLGGGNV